jgi:uncharacterized repeat protein (TIGR01451 family)
MRKRILRLWAVAVAGLLVLVVGVGAASGDGVNPSSFTGTLASGTSVTIQKTVTTPAIAPNPDLVFLADTTGSMGTAIGNVKSNALNVMAQVAAAQPAGVIAEFGAASYKDFNCDAVPYELDSAVTDNQSAVSAAINSNWNAGGGCDEPESALNALQRLALDPATAWRTNSSRIIAWFGDAPSHDPTGPGDSVTQASAIAALVAQGVRVIAINSGAGGLDALGQATAVTNATGGVLLNLGGGNDIAQAILDGLHNLPAAVTPVPTCDAGLSATYDHPSLTVPSGTDAVFQETLSVAPNAPDGGTLHCSVDFLINGISTPGFQQQVSIDVPLRPADLSLAKSAAPALVTEGGNVTYTLQATNNASDPNPGVSAVDVLPAGESFVSGDPGCSAVGVTVTCDFGTLGPLASASKSFVAHVPLGAPSLITNSAMVSGGRPDPNLANNTATAQTAVNHNPTCTGVSAGPDLWPPNHRMVSSSIAGVTDADGNAVSVTIDSLRQDEPTNGLGDGDTAIDGVIGAGNSFAVRAERSGTADGRVYHVGFTATDGLGGSCSGSASIGVPHDQGKGAVAVDGGSLFNSTL